MAVSAAGRGLYWWRKGRGVVIWPLAVGLVLLVLGLWAGLTYHHNQAVFRAEAVQTSAVIDRLYTSAPTQNYGPSTFDEYAVVHYSALGERTQARVLLATNCTGTCVASYRVGQVLTVAYSPKNGAYAQLPSQIHGPSPGLLYAFGMLLTFGLIFLAAAVINAWPVRRL
ncbi:MAG TPA: DUF3592 domain-containing protein [Streptosporangiaceae bacterium]|nr:DUF3592 domain-containing protein [Streptosporangiaceae bacterium]